MKRHLEPVDLMVAVGVLATVIGAYALFWATSGALQAALPEPVAMTPETGIMDAIAWVQPTLGQAIVDDAVMQREASWTTTKAVRKLNQATMADHWLQASPFGYVDQIGAYAAAVEAGHAARVQFVMGRAITNFTARGVRSGVLSPSTIDGEYNRTMIALAESRGRQIDKAFQDGWQSSLGRTILAAGQDYLQFSGLSQGRVGQSVVGLVLVQDTYHSRINGMQEQLASVALASIQAEQITNWFARRASANLGATRTGYPLTEPKSWPDVPLGILFAASAALIGIFFVGISVPTGWSKMRTKLPEEVEVQESYRKSA